MRIVIPLFERFTALDVVGPYEVLTRLPDAEVTLAAVQRGELRDDKRSLALLADASFDEMPAADVLVVPGGLGTRVLLEDDELLGWLRTVDATTTWTTSVCTGALLLGAAGILRGLEATTHWLQLERLREFGAVPVEDRVVRRGKVITAAGVSAGIDMALTLAALLCGDDVAQAIQLSIQYDPQPPFDAGNPTTAPERVVTAVRKRAG